MPLRIPSLLLGFFVRPRITPFSFAPVTRSAVQLKYLLNFTRFCGLLSTDTTSRTGRNACSSTFAQISTSYSGNALCGDNRQYPSKAMKASFPAPRPSSMNKSGHRGKPLSDQNVQRCSAMQNFSHGIRLNGKYFSCRRYFSSKTSSV